MTTSCSLEWIGLLISAWRKVLLTDILSKRSRQFTRWRAAFGTNIIAHTIFRLPRSGMRKSWKQSLQQIPLLQARRRTDFSTMSYLSRTPSKPAVAVPTTPHLLTRGPHWPGHHCTQRPASSAHDTRNN